MKIFILKLKRFNIYMIIKKSHIIMITIEQKGREKCMMNVESMIN